MKTVTNHLGQIILSVAAIALVVGVVLSFGGTIFGFFDGVTGKLSDLATGEAIWNVGGSDDESTTLSAPTNLYIANSTLNFDVVEFADTYTLYVNGEEATTSDTNSFDVSTYLDAYTLPIDFSVSASNGTSSSENGTYTLDWEGTWVFNEELNFDTLTPSTDYSLNFIVNEKEYVGIKYAERYNGVYWLRYTWIDTSSSNRYYEVYQTAELWGTPAGWSSIDYVTINITSKPEDETLKAWLYANITRQDAGGHTHSFDTLTETVAATCIANGYEIYTCECGETRTIEDVTGWHSFTNNLCDLCGVSALEYTLSEDETSYTITDCIEYATEIKIPAEYNGLPVTTIGNHAFQGCTSLESVTIPASVTTIGYSAFQGCTSLESVTIPASVTTIGYDAFNGCTNLTSITFEEGSQLTFIAHSTFDNCTSLESIVIPASVTSINYLAFRGCTSLKSITIPEGVTTIGEDAFYNCISLESVTIPEGVTYIGTYAFNSCTSLTSITYKGTVEQWNAIGKATGDYPWDGNTGDYTIYCTDGTIAKNGTVTMN